MSVRPDASQTPRPSLEIKIKIHPPPPRHCPPGRSLEIPLVVRPAPHGQPPVRGDRAGLAPEKHQQDPPREGQPELLHVAPVHRPGNVSLVSVLPMDQAPRLDICKVEGESDSTASLVTVNGYEESAEVRINAPLRLGLWY